MRECSQLGRQMRYIKVPEIMFRPRCSTHGNNSESRMKCTLHYLNTNPASSVHLIDVDPPRVSIFIRWQTNFTWPITLTAFHWCVKDGRKERKKRQ